MKYFIKSIFTILFISFLNNINAQFMQLGNKLVGSGYTGNSEQGWSVAISGDGNTAIVGAPSNSSERGSVWIYVKNNGSWSQQASLYGTGYIGSPKQGYSVSLSSDGNTAIVGGQNDNGGIGAAWIFVRQNGYWSQQGSKLVGTGAIGNAHQGCSVSLSSDGNTAIVGGDYDNNYIGAAWIFVRKNSKWTQQDSKLFGTGGTINSYQGYSVSLSSDGNTAIVGGQNDNIGTGAAWIFKRQGSNWSQQGSKLVGSGAIGYSHQGHSVSLSSDGNTAIMGGPDDNGGIGATWIFIRQGSNWSQQGAKLVGSGAIGFPSQGWSLSLSADGNTAIVGGPNDNGGIGAAWIFKRQGSQWIQQGNKLVGSGNIGSALQSCSVSISADGNTAIAGGYNDNNGIGAAWIFTPYNTISAAAGTGGTISPSGDVNVNYGSDQTFTITPNTGYHISDVLADGQSKGPVVTYTFPNVTADHTISASFAINQYTITSSSGLHGSISPSGNTLVNYGSAQTYNFYPDQGYHVSDVIVDGLSKGAQPDYTFSNVTGSHTISVSFAPNTYIITSQAEPGGTITPTGNVEVQYGENQTFTITPNAGYKIHDVLLDNNSIGTPSSYTISDIKGDHTISASFEIEQFTITSSSGAHGTISPIGSVPVNRGQSQTFNFYPADGYHVSNVIVDNAEIPDLQQSYTFTNIQSDHEIKAEFALDQFIITATQSEHGKITPEGVTNVSSGSSQTYIITPDQGYTVQQVLADNQSVGAVTSYTFTNVTSNHTIMASFGIITYKITATSGEHGTITPSGEVNVNYGSSQEYTVTPNSGYHISDVIVDGQSKGAVNTYKFENISSDHTISASFAMDIPEELPIPVAVSPKGGVTLYTNTPTLYWSVDGNTTGLTFKVKYSTDPNNGNANGDMKIIDAGSSMSITLPPLPWGKTYFWQVQSVKGSASSEYSSIDSFKVAEEQVVVNPEVPVPAWPIGGATVYLSSQYLTWYLLSGWSNIQSFTLRWGEGNILSNVIDGITSITYPITGLLPGHTYSWKVESVDKQGHHSLSSDVQSFTTAGGASNKPYTPTQAWPVGGAIVYVTSPTLSWYMLQPGFGIKEYLVRYSKNPDMSGASEIHQSGLINVLTLTGLEKGMTYYWQVQSYDGQVYSDPQIPPASFTVYTDWLTSSYSPMALSPSGGIALSTSSVQLSWAAANGNDKSLSYNIQYSTNKDFSNPVEVKNISQTSFKTDRLNNSVYYWRVQSKTKDGIVSSYSPVGKFSVKTVTGIMADRINEHEFCLLQNYPNPFNPTTSIAFNLPNESDITVEVFNSIGKTVSQIYKGIKPKGVTTLEFNAEDLPSGIYFYKIIALDTNGNMNYAIKKMIILK